MNRLLKMFRRSLNMKITAISILSVLLGLCVLIFLTQNNMKNLTDLSLKTMKSEMDILVHEYYDNYISEISTNMEETIHNIEKENQIIAGIIQLMFDNEEEFKALNKVIETMPYFKDKINHTGNWYQNSPDEPTVVFIPGISIDESGKIQEAVSELVSQTALLDLIMPAFAQYGVNKLQVYYQGGNREDMFRLAPWSDIGKNIFDVYPELNELPIWETFNPGLVDDMNTKMANLKRDNLPSTELSKASPPVQDGLTGEIVITFGTPIWSNDYSKFDGSIGYDVPITDIIERIEKIKLSETGFAFLSQSNGNVFAVNESGAQKLGIADIQSSTENAETGFNRLKRFIHDSKYDTIKTLDLSATNTAFTTVTIEGADYVVITKPVKAYQTWSTEQGYYDEYWTLGFVVSSKELFKGHLNAGLETEKSLKSTLLNQLVISFIVIVLMILTIALFNSRVTKQLDKLAVSASSISEGVYTPVEDFESSDEIGVLTKALNQMTREIGRSFNELQMSEEKYRSLIENVDNMIFSISPSKQFIALNSSFEKLMEIPRSEIIGMKINEVFNTAEEGAYWETVFDQVLQSKEKKTSQTTLDLQDGTKRYLSVTLIPIVDASGEVTMVLGSNTDISELVMAQEEIANLHLQEKTTLESKIAEKTNELELAKQDLIQKEKLASLGSLVTGIAHELNTPLGTAVSAGSYLEYVTKQLSRNIENESLTHADLVAFIADINQSSALVNLSLQRAAKLVVNFKDISVSQSQEEKVHINISDYIQIIIMSLHQEISSKDFHINVKCPEDMEMNTYPGVFLQIVSHLIQNSIIHGYDGISTGHHDIDIDFRATGDKMILHYVDYGKGITADNLSHIFEPFFTTTRGQGGTGLGLNVVYNLVTSKLGGKISCQSTLGVGTTFTIEIPLE